jgi:hypothetical protein
LIEKIKTAKDPLDKEYNTIKEELDRRNQTITGLKSVPLANSDHGS